MNLKRTFYRWTEPPSHEYEDGEREQVDDPAAAQLVGSAVCGSTFRHLPLFDIDYDAELIPSSTPGHFHLYLNKPISWTSYVKVLEAMRDAGLIETGYADNMIRRGEAFLRVPHHRKAAK